MRLKLFAIATALMVFVPPSTALAGGGITATTGGAEIHVSGSSSVGSPV